MMKKISNVFRALTLLFVCSAMTAAQIPVNFDDMWSDCNLVCKPLPADEFFKHPDYEQRIEKAMEISAVLDDLGGMRDHFLRTGDFRDLFPAVYFNTTETEFQHIMNDEMNYPVDKMNMMENFYDAFAMNRAAYQTGGISAVEPHWQLYYRNAELGNAQLSKTGFMNNTELSNRAFKVLNAGVDAHVDFDLPRAIRKTIEQSDVSVSDLKIDFDKTDPYFDKSTTLGKKDINDALIPGTSQLDRGVGNLMATMLASLSGAGGTPDIVAKRKNAWRQAVNDKDPLPTAKDQPQYQHPKSTSHLPEELKNGICFALTDESSYAVQTIYNTEKKVCETDTIKQAATGKISFGPFAGSAGPDGFNYPAFSGYSYSDLTEYNHGSLILSVGQEVVGGGSQSEKTCASGGEIRLIVNDQDYENNDGEFGVKITLSGNRLYRLK